jgi:predicted aspartyl protease
MIIPTKLLLAKRAMRTKKGNNVGRFSVEFEVYNFRDQVAAEIGALEPAKIRHTHISGVVDSGASQLVLPEKVAKELGVPLGPKIKVRYADGRRATRNSVNEVQLEILGRRGIFQAVVEPRRKDALIGAIVLEVLDFLPDCTRQRLIPRDPNFIVGELE